VFPRISVFRSLKHIYAQLIDDSQHKTLASCSSFDVETKGDKKAVARSVGVELAARAKSKGVEQAVLDRGGFLYHGRVKALAEGLREGGLKI
jgi:large subunit ribosomal protein L18